jgi:alkanesulfonate monooxygenase SsuD/methylene tetrahydromethanopterin reductase-like flavin-dependent oxidoreductase (luciferase family)
MHLGLFNLMTKRDREKPTREVYVEMREQVQLAEECGFEIAWFAEHHFSNYGMCPSPLTMATYMAGQTSRIKLGPAVIVAPLYEPLRMLEDLAVLDQISDGRLVVGLGCGYQRHEFHKFGLDLDEARDRFVEYLDVVGQFFESEPLSYDGKFLKIPETYFSVRPLQRSPETYVAGLVRDSVTQQHMAQRGYVSVNTAGAVPMATAIANRGGVEEVYRSVGLDPVTMPLAIQQYVHITDDHNEALEAADNVRFIRRVVAAMRGGYVELDGSWLHEQVAEDESTLEEMLPTTYIGSPDEVAERMILQLERLRPSHLSCHMAIGGVPAKSVMRTIERFTAEVLPQVERHFGGLDRVGGESQAGATAAE